jgi:predicted acetyltransferase
MSYNTANTAGTKQVKNIITTSNEAAKIKADKLAKEKAEARYYAAELAKNKGKVPDSKYAYLDERAAPVADNTRVDPSYLPFAQQEIKFANQAQNEEERKQEDSYRTGLSGAKSAQDKGFKNAFDYTYNPKGLQADMAQREAGIMGYDSKGKPMFWSKAQEEEYNYEHNPWQFKPAPQMHSGAAGSADWFWTLPLAIPAALSALAGVIPGTGGLTLGTAVEAGFGIEGADMIYKGNSALQKADAMPENTYEQKLAKLDAQNAAYGNMGLGAVNMLPLGIRGLKGSKSLSNVDDAYTFAKNPVTINKNLTGKTPLELPIGERPFGYGNQDVYNNMIKEFDKANGPVEGLGKITEGTNILPSKDPGFISELNAAKFKMQSGLDSPVGPQIGRLANRWRDIDRIDLDVPSIEELQNFDLDESALAFPANINNETILNSQQRAMIKNIEGAKQTALSKGDTDLAKQFDTFVSKIKNDALKKFTETPYTGEQAMSSTTLNYSGNEIPDLPNYLSDEQINKGYELVQDENRIFLNKNGKSAGQIELMSSDSPMISSNGEKFGSIDIDIDPSHRGKNLSKPMYEALLDMANKKGLDGIISTDNLLDSPAQSKAIRKYFDGEYSSDPELLKQENASIAEMNKHIEEDNLAWGDNDPLIEKVDKVYILKPKKSNIKNKPLVSNTKNLIDETDKNLALHFLKEQNKKDIMGHSTTEMHFNDWKNQKLLDLETLEGQRRIEKFLNDNPSKVNVNDFMDKFKNLKYYNVTKPMQKDILNNVDKINDVTDKITKLTKDRDQYYDIINEDNWTLYNKEIERLDAEITMLENDKDGLMSDTEDIIKLIDKKNKSAFYESGNNSIFIGEEYQTSQELPRLLGHEGSHPLTARLLGQTSFNSKMDQDLIKELTLTKRLPKHLKKKLSVEEIRNTPSGASEKGAIDKAWNPKEYWKDAKEYWESGLFKKGQSNEPTSFIAEIRAGMKEDGIIKNDYDPITEDMLKAYYEDYIKKPLHHSSLRVFDIMENDASNFKVLKKHINNLLSLAPYLIPAGVGVGAAASSGEDNTPQYKYGGNVNKLQKFIK